MEPKERLFIDPSIYESIKAHYEEYIYEDECSFDDFVDYVIQFGLIKIEDLGRSK